MEDLLPPYSIAISPNGTTAYVANWGSNSVTPINTATNTAGTPIGVGTNPQTIAITPDGKTAYVANSGNSSITPIDLATNKAGTPVPVKEGAFGIAITPNGKTAYVVEGGTSSGSEGFCYVTPVNLTTRTAEKPICWIPVEPIRGLPACRTTLLPRTAPPSTSSGTH